jgi:hypothetical protein
MANAYSNTTYKFSTPYLTLTEFKNAPTAIDLDNLVFNSQDPDVQDAELTNVIARASSWIDTYCNQVLAATTETENLRSRITSDGTLRIHPRYNPIIALLAFSYGNPTSQMNPVTDPSVAWIEDSQIIIPCGNLGFNYSTQGPLQFGLPAAPRSEMFINLQYVAGYANTTVVSGTAGQSTIVVSDPTGIIAGMSLRIYDGFNSELITIASNHTYGSATVALAQPLAYNHSSGVSVSALPPAIKEAAILVTTAMLKVRGDNSMVMSVSSRPSQAAPGAQNMGGDLKQAQDLLAPYRRIR